MTSILLSEDALALLKRSCRQQLPGIKHSHILEALANSMMFKSWVSLNAALASLPPFLASRIGCRRQISLDALKSRLGELGYAQQQMTSISVADLEDDLHFFADSATQHWDASRDPLCLLHWLKRLGSDLAEYEKRYDLEPDEELPGIFAGLSRGDMAFWTLIELVVSRDRRTDTDASVETILPFLWKGDDWDLLSATDRQEHLGEILNYVALPIFFLLLANPITVKVGEHSRLRLCHSRGERPSIMRQ